MTLDLARLRRQVATRIKMWGRPVAHLRGPRGGIPERPSEYIKVSAFDLEELLQRLDKAEAKP